MTCRLRRDFVLFQADLNGSAGGHFFGICVGQLRCCIFNTPIHRLHFTGEIERTFANIYFFTPLVLCHSLAGKESPPHNERCI